MCKEVKIPFNDWSKTRLLDGSKTATSRTKKYGNVGDVFKVEDKTFQLDLVTKLPLGFVTNYLNVTEGAISKSEFIDVWEKIHPRKGWVPEQKVWYHHFFNKNKELKK